MAATRKKSRSRKADSEDGDVKAGSVRPDEMSAEVVEFITAIDDYKRAHRRPFPSWSEVLDIVKGLGYARPAR